MVEKKILKVVQTYSDLRRSWFLADKPSHNVDLSQKRYFKMFNLEYDPEELKIFDLFVNSHNTKSTYTCKPLIPLYLITNLKNIEERKSVYTD